MARTAADIQAELEALQRQASGGLGFLYRNLDAPPQLRRGPGGGQALEQGKNALAAVALSSALGPAGLLIGAGMMASTRRDRRIAEEVYENTQQGIRQQNEEFAARTAYLREQFTAGAEAGDPVAGMNAAQLDEIVRRHAEGFRLSQEFDPRRSEAGMAIMNEASAALGGWLEDIETRTEKLRDQEFTILRQELTAATNNLDSIDKFRTDEINRFGLTQRIWEETSNPGQRRAVFNDYMQSLREDMTDAQIVQSLVRAGVTAVGAVGGMMVGGAPGAITGALGGSGAAQLVSAIAKGEISFSDDEMRRIMAAAHQFRVQSSEILRGEHVQRVEGITERLQELNPFSTLPESFTREYRRIDVPPLRDFEAGAVSAPSREDRERMLREGRGFDVMREAWRQLRQNARPTEETP